MTNKQNIIVLRSSPDLLANWFGICDQYGNVTRQGLLGTESGLLDIRHLTHDEKLRFRFAVTIGYFYPCNDVRAIQQRIPVNSDLHLLDSFKGGSNERP